MDERGLAVADAMFEGILDQGDEQQGGDHGIRFGGGYLRFQFHMLRQADAHQFHIVADKIQFAFQQDVRLATVVKDVTQQAT